MSLYNPVDRSINVTVVPDSTTTRGLQNPADGSYYVVIAPGDGVKRGTHHKSGAWYVSLAPSNNFYTYNPIDASYYVSTTPFTNGGMHVTVVSGSLNPGSPYTLPAASGSYLLTGDNMTPSLDHIITASSASYIYTGIDAALIYTPIAASSRQFATINSYLNTDTSRSYGNLAYYVNV